jgi:hypothetical protein
MIVVVANVTEPAQGGRRGIGVTHALAAEFLGPEIQMQAYLVVGVLHETLTRRRKPKETADAAGED